MPISINEITSGIGLKIDNDIYLVIEYHHVKPGKGSAFVKVKLKNVKTHQVLERTFRSSERLDDAELEERRLQYQYSAGDAFHFMDSTTFEQIILGKDVIDEDTIKFLQDNLELTGICYNHQILKIALPTFIITQVIHTDPGLKGDSAKSGGKPAEIDTGATIQVPLFINVGDWIKVDTRSGNYVERVQK